LQKDRFQAVIDEYYNFISEFPESKYRVEVEKMHTTANTMLNSDRNKNESKEILKNQ
jgi:outer membrane protein assembly factor BamD